MITADMARSIADEHYTTINQRQKFKIDICLDQIERSIKACAQEGAYSFIILNRARFFVGQEVEKEVKNALEFMNFKVQNDTNKFIISWGEPKEGGSIIGASRFWTQREVFKIFIQFAQFRPGNFVYFIQEQFS